MTVTTCDRFLINRGRIYMYKITTRGYLKTKHSIKICHQRGFGHIEINILKKNYTNDPSYIQSMGYSSNLQIRWLRYDSIVRLKKKKKNDRDLFNV